MVRLTRGFIPKSFAGKFSLHLVLTFEGGYDLRIVVPDKPRSQNAPNPGLPRRAELESTPEVKAVPATNSGSPSRQELEAEIALYRHALEKSREEFKAFAYAVSHDLRGPLRAIEGFSKILLEDFADSLTGEPRQFLGNIITNSQTLASQLDDLLKLYRASRHDPTKISVDADAVCKEALAQLEGDLSRISIVQQPLPLVMADPVQLREVFSQLLANAVKSTFKTPQPAIQIGAKLDPAATTFFVRDNGIGFDPRKTERLFQVFQKMHAPADFRGNGIGLALTKRLVEAHGGCVSADAEPGKGAVFCFSLPNGVARVLTPPNCLATAAP